MIYRKNLALGFLALGLLYGCTSSSSPTNDFKPGSVNHPPIIQSAKLASNHIVRGGIVFTQVNASDFDGDFITLRYQWLCNGKPITGQTSSTLLSQMLKRGDLLAVDLIPYDGKIEGAIYRTEAVAIGNSSPEVKNLALEPREIRIGDRIEARAQGFDADNDSIEYKFRWWLNNQEILGKESNVLETAGFSRGDTIVVQVTPTDDMGGVGKAFFAGPVKLINSPPRITSMPPLNVMQKLYEYPVTAIDPDGDALVYSLEMSPIGMKIDPATGFIEWKIPAESRGIHRTRIKVTDSDESFAYQEFDLIFSPSSLLSKSSFSKRLRRSSRLVSRF